MHERLAEILAEKKKEVARLKKSKAPAQAGKKRAGKKSPK